jgi:Tfp pilus assembly protein PilF
MAKGRQRHKAQETATKASARMALAWRLFDEGDKLLARREAKSVLADSPSGPDAEQARDLLARTAIPRIALFAGSGAAALIILLILLAIART